MLTIGNSANIRFYDKEEDKHYVTSGKEVVQMLKFKTEAENLGYRTIDNEGNLVNPDRFNELDVIAEETGEFICNLILTDDHIEKLIEKGTLEVLKEAISKNPLKIEKVIINYPATIVWFDDGTKIIVKISEDDKFDPEIGIAMAVMKKAFGSRTAYQKFVRQWATQESIIMQKVIKKIQKADKLLYQ